MKSVANLIISGCYSSRYSLPITTTINRDNSSEKKGDAERNREVNGGVAAQLSEPTYLYPPSPFAHFFTSRTIFAAAFPLPKGKALRDIRR